MPSEIENLIAEFIEAIKIEPGFLVSIVGFTFAIIFAAIVLRLTWKKTNNKVFRISIIILVVMSLSKSLKTIQSSMKEAKRKITLLKNFEAKSKEVSLSFDSQMTELAQLHQEAKEINLGQLLEEIETQLSKRDVEIEDYCEALNKLQDAEDEMGFLINDFDEQEVAKFHMLLSLVFSVLKKSYEDYPEILKDIYENERMSNAIKKTAFSKEKIALIKVAMEQGLEKLFEFLKEKYPSPEKRQLIIKDLRHDNRINLLEELVGTESFCLIAEKIVRDLTEPMQVFAKKIELNFDLEKYIQNEFNHLQKTPEGQKKIVEDIKEIKKNVDLLTKRVAKEIFSV